MPGAHNILLRSTCAVHEAGLSIKAALIARHIVMAVSAWDPQAYTKNLKGRHSEGALTFSGRRAMRLISSHVMCHPKWRYTGRSADIRFRMTLLLESSCFVMSVSSCTFPVSRPCRMLHTYSSTSAPVNTQALPHVDAHIQGHAVAEPQASDARHPSESVRPGRWQGIHWPLSATGLRVTHKACTVSMRGVLRRVNTTLGSCECFSPPGP